MARIVGAIFFGALGALIGTGTGIVGGAFGAIAGIFIFVPIGLLYGFSVGPDIERLISKFRK